MSSILKVDTIQDQSGNNIISEAANVITIGASGDTITVPAGATVSGFTSAGIDDNATSTALFINSSNRVTVGTDSGYGLDNSADDFVVANTGNDSGMSIVSNASNSSSIFFTDTGNSSIGKIVYSHSSNDMKFTTTNSERMRIDSSGSVGIGTTSPFNTRPGAFTISNEAPTIYMEDTNGSGDKVGQILYQNAELSYSTGSRNGTGTSSSTEYFRITSAGNVGIGDSAPLGKLHVKSADSGASVNSGHNQVIAENSGNSGMSILSGTSSNGAICFGDSGNNCIGYVNYAHNGNHLDFGVNSSEAMRILSDGKVGIGTSSPTKTLTVAGDMNVQQAGDNMKADFSNGVNANFRISTAGTVAQIGPSTASDVAFLSGNAEKMRMTSAGLFGIGETAPQGKLHVKTSDSGVSSSPSHSNELILENSTNGGMTFNCGASNSATMTFQNSTNADDGSITYRNSEREFRFKTAGADRIRFHSNGVISSTGGIALGVGTANTASNVLDDYEEGTWSPKLGNETTAVYSNQTGWYRKIGNTVFIYFSVSLSSKGDISGAYTKIANLPFNGAPGGDRFGSGQIHAYRLGSSAHIQGIEFGGGTVSVGWILTGGGSTNGYLNTSFVANNTFFEGFATYKTI